MPLALLKVPLLQMYTEVMSITSTDHLGFKPLAKLHSLQFNQQRRKPNATILMVLAFVS
jgi:hypothetical protein